MTDVTSAMQTALGLPVLRPVWLCRLDIASDPVASWDGPGIYAPTTSGDSEMDGYSFEPVNGEIVDISNIKESIEGLPGAMTLTLAGVDPDEPLLRQIVRDDRSWLGRNAFVWLGLLDSTDATRPVVQYPSRVRSCFITGIKIIRDTRPGESGGDQPAGAVVVTIDEDISRAKADPYYYANQANYFSADTGAAFMANLANNPNGIKGAADNAPIVGGAGSGGIAGAAGGYPNYAAWAAAQGY